jgi:hypothetical protein
MGTLMLNPALSAAIAARIAPLLPVASKPQPQPKPKAQETPPKSGKDRLRAEAKTVHKQLAKRYPFAARNHKPPTLLKIGIDRDIRALLPERRRAAISLFLHFYTRHPAYQRLVKADGPRLDLDGRECVNDRAEQA